MIGVYIQHDDRQRVTAISSENFLPDTTDWVKIDEGEGDRYAHAQGNYLDESLYDTHGVPVFKWTGKKLQRRKQSEIDADIAALPLQPPEVDFEIEVARLNNKVDGLEGELLGAYLAAAELYERTLQLEAENLTTMMALTELYESRGGM